MVTIQRYQNYKMFDDFQLDLCNLTKQNTATWPRADGFDGLFGTQNQAMTMTPLSWVNPR